MLLQDWLQGHVLLLHTYSVHYKCAEVKFPILAGVPEYFYTKIIITRTSPKTI